MIVVFKRIVFFVLVLSTSLSFGSTRKSFEETFELFLNPKLSCHFPYLSVDFQNRKISKEWSVNGTVIDSKESAEKTFLPLVKRALEDMKMTSEELDLRGRVTKRLQEIWEGRGIYSDDASDKIRSTFYKRHNWDAFGINNLYYLVDYGRLSVQSVLMYEGDNYRSNYFRLRFFLKDFNSYSFGNYARDFPEVLFKVLSKQNWKDSNGKKIIVKRKDFRLGMGENAPNGYLDKDGNEFCR